MINKYLLYLVILVFAFLLTFGVRIYHLITYEKSIGKTVSYVDEYFPSSRGGYHIKHYPKIAFETSEGRHSFLAPSYMYDASREMGYVKVIYDKSNPEKAYVFNFYGFWGAGLIFYLPFFLIWTITICSVGFIPTQININKFIGK